MKKVLYPHRCEYFHSWEITVDTQQSDYPDPLQRFCHECLQDGRMEVGSIQMMSPPDRAPRLHLFCEHCFHTMMIALLPECSLISDPDAIDTFVRRGKEVWWFHLPYIWPRCAYCQESLTLKKKEILTHAESSGGSGNHHQFDSSPSSC